MPRRLFQNYLLPWCFIWCNISYEMFLWYNPFTIVIFHLDIILLPWWNIFYLDIILIPWCDIWLPSVEHFLPWYHLLPWCYIFYLDIMTTMVEHFLPGYHFTTVMWHFLPWYHFTAVMWPFLPWYYFTVMMENIFFNPDMRNTKDVINRKGVKCMSPQIKHCTFPD